MKKFHFLFSICFAVLFIACDKKNVDPLDNVTTGAYPRELSFDGNLSLSDISNSKIEFTVEFEDGNNGENVSHYSWIVEYRDVSNSGNVTNGVDLLTVGASEFTTNADGNLETTIVFEFQDIIDKLSLDPQDLTGVASQIQSDSFRFFSELHMKDGSSFDSNNTSTEIINGFGALFFFEEFVRP